jgi:hypothetical protein
MHWAFEKDDTKRRKGCDGWCCLLVIRLARGLSLMHRKAGAKSQVKERVNKERAAKGALGGKGRYVRNKKCEWRTGGKLVGG